MVYLFFAGHAVVAERGESYFVAHDSDPQNLHATGVSFQEINETLTNKVRAATVVLLADACHAGGIGWTSDPSVPSKRNNRSSPSAAKDRAFLKLLASRPSERSFEDERWGGGHGVFTYSVLTALRGAAERERDGLFEYRNSSTTFPVWSLSRPDRGRIPGLPEISKAPSRWLLYQTRSVERAECRSNAKPCGYCSKDGSIA